jgi:hypothetical protein
VTRFKELQRIRLAIQHKKISELKWALDYCRMRVGIAGQFSKQSAQQKHWRNIEQQVGAPMSESDPQNSTKSLGKISPCGNPAPRLYAFVAF